MARRTKIVATIGPVSCDEETLAAMMHAGMNVARIPLAHTSVEDGLVNLARVRKVAAEIGVTVGTMVDLPGPLVRTGHAGDNGMSFEPGDELTLVEGNGPTAPGIVTIDYPNLADELDVGDQINLGESIIATVTSIDEPITAKIISGGLLAGRSAVRIPSRSYQKEALTKDDIAAVAAFVEAGVDIVALSARHGDDLAQLDLQSPPYGPLLMAKIESMVAVENLKSLIAQAEGIIIGRGGLGLEVRLEDLPHIQKSVIEQCIASGLPVITASQILESMIKAPVPTRAETTDVTNAIIDGTSGLMLSAETAIGDHPAAVVATMSRIAARADEQFDHVEWGRRVAELRMANGDQDTTITDAMTIGAARTAEELGLGTLLCISASGFTVRSMARFRPKAQIIGVSRHIRTAQQLASSWGVTPLHYSSTAVEYEGKVDEAVAAAATRGLVEPGALVGVVAGITSANRATDTFRIVRVPATSSD